MKHTAHREAMLAAAVRFLASEGGHYQGKTGYVMACAIGKAGLWKPACDGGTRRLNRVRKREIARLGKSVADQLSRLGVVELSPWARGYRNRRVWKLTEKGRELADVLAAELPPEGAQVAGG